ncbi:MAG: sulfatase-like hydrolase/transferase, partial [Verrucomicrobiota bacterium]
MHTSQQSFFLAVVAACFCLKLQAQESPSILPNIVIVMADDMGIGDTSAYLGKHLGPTTEPIAKTLRTPTLEDFAESGVVFTNAYAPASMCSSTRYSLLTGRYSHRAYLKKQGWLPHGPNTPMIQRALTTLPEMLQSRGYHTAAIGKYHVGMAFNDSYGGVADEFGYSDVDFTQPVLDGPSHHGFDVSFTIPGNTEDPLDTEPRVYIRNDRWEFQDKARMKRIGFKRLEGRILAAPDWDLAEIGPTL